MRGNHLFVVALLVGITISASAGIVISDYSTSASTNAFAPLDRSMYFNEQLVQNTSPAGAAASGDWNGTNIGGSTNTWHWIGSSHIDTVTTLDNESLTITAAGSFNWDISTTSDFYSPNRVETLFGPGSAAGYSCSFILDAPAIYTVKTQLNRYSYIKLSSVSDGQVVVTTLNISTIPVQVDTAGMLPAGEYLMTAGTNRFGLGFIEGANHEVRTGSFTNFLFTVQAPEPSFLAFGVMGAIACRRRR